MPTTIIRGVRWAVSEVSFDDVCIFEERMLFQDSLLVHGRQTVHREGQHSCARRRYWRRGACSNNIIVGFQTPLLTGHFKYGHIINNDEYADIGSCYGGLTSLFFCRDINVRHRKYMPHRASEKSQTIMDSRLLCWRSGLRPSCWRGAEPFFCQD